MSITTPGEMDQKIFTSFERREEFLALQNKILYPTEEERARGYYDTYGLVTMKISGIFNEYLEQSYLLDSHLEDLLTPVVTQLKAATKETPARIGDKQHTDYVGSVGQLLYYYVKFRGYKTITRFFPHEIADLDIALGFLLLPDGPASELYYWWLRYVMLLWLSLICMLPFDLEQFDEAENRGQTASQIESVAKAHLNNAGLERDAAALLLSRYYTRKDMVHKLAPFLQWTKELIPSSSELLRFMGALRACCEIAKTGAAEIVNDHSSMLLDITTALGENKTMMSNTVIRKLRTKLISRIILRGLPGNTRRTRRHARVLLASSSESQAEHLDDVDIDVPEETESVLEDLFQTLQDKDTVVRYSAAKGISRIAERLPADFCEQILETILNLYTIHPIVLTGMNELPTVAEATWHGATLACAEIARRGLIPDHKLDEVLGWQGKALYFDLRQGSHSIGSSVRDAASYVVWSLAKAQSPSALAPFMDDLSRILVTVSIYDREVHIRRAASAAFQECVGRTSLCPHGIPVLGKIDFFSVGLQRNAFLVAAPEVAKYEDYRQALIDHVIGTTIRHWDPNMRELGAQSLREICRLDMGALAPAIAARMAEYLKLPDSIDVHGALLTLTELAACCNIPELEPLRRQIFGYLSIIPSFTVLSPRQELITAAACNLIAASVALVDLETHAQDVQPPWRRIVEFGLKSKGVPVQEAAAQAMSAISSLVDCSSAVHRLIQEAKQPAAQQALCRMLGLLDYNKHHHGLLEVLRFLLDSVNSQSRTKIQNVEGRRNAYVSIAQILENVAPRLNDQLTSAVVCEMFDALLAGLKDYTTDERGDVGSWIRVACIKGLVDMSIALLSNGAHIQHFEENFPPAKFHEAIAGILKQGVERLDNVREAAGVQLLRLLEFQIPEMSGKERWIAYGDALMRQLFLGNEERVGWHEGNWLFPRAVRLLEIEPYRQQLISGLVLSVSTKTDSTQRPISTSLVNYAKSLPTEEAQDTPYSIQHLAEDLINHCSQKLASNSVVIPVLQTFNVLLEGDAFDAIQDDPTKCQSLQTLFSIATRNVSKVKNIQRISSCMRIAVTMLPMSQFRTQCIQKLPEFLAHQFPRIRADTAEYLYTILQTKDMGIETDEAEDVILETEWSTETLSSVQETAKRCVELLSQEPEDEE
ncbi:TBCD protein [Cristinia sonorae]|uniref:TBCD protein n=1 Tax=Cristinia sonorae TaxID=1940300 RepID=A0A8K0XSS5_9AGAR|nr:TBCD protein [Cristinia sonorae]